MPSDLSGYEQRNEIRKAFAASKFGYLSAQLDAQDVRELIAMVKERTSSRLRSFAA